MKLRIFSLMLCAALCLSLSACGGAPSGAAPASGGSAAAASSSAPAAPDLTGDWKQVNAASEDSYQVATIQGDTIEIYWVTESADTKSLYWAGTFVAPETADEPYTWESANDTEKTGSALLASGDETKTFTYQDGQISYDVSAMGMTQTVRLEKQ
jgi:hypothetical protein|nr:MAG TPA: Nitrite reductase barrel, nitrite reduction, OXIDOREDUCTASE [Caudoviricetes sp.]